MSFSFTKTIFAFISSLILSCIYITSSIFAMGKEDLLTITDSYIGSPSNYGGYNAEEGFDSANFTRYIHENYFDNPNLPRSGYEQRRKGVQVDRNDLMPGDVVFIQGSSNTMSSIYVGDGNIAIVTNSGVDYRHLEQDSYYNNRYITARRFTHENEIVQTAKTLSGNNPKNWITSEFTQEVFQRNGHNLPRRATNQLLEGSPVNKNELQPGDIVFFEGSFIMSGIYIGDDHFLIVTQSYGIVKRDIQESPYFSSRYLGAVRLGDGHPVTASSLSLMDGDHDHLLSSEFAKETYENAKGVKIPDNSSEQKKYGKEISKSELEEGDLVFLEGGTSTMSAVYIGFDRFVTSTNSGIAVRSFDHSYYQDRFLSARRFDDDMISLYETNKFTYIYEDESLHGNELTYVNAEAEMKLLGVYEDSYKIKLHSTNGFVSKENVQPHSSSPSYFSSEDGELYHHTRGSSWGNRIAQSPTSFGDGKTVETHSGFEFPGDDYYNYYQFLSVRTPSQYNGDDIDRYLESVRPDSPLIGLGDTFIEEGEKNNLNPMFIFAAAVHESAFGLSDIAQDKNNLFGLNATDDNPYGNADEFDSLESNIQYFSREFIQGYLNPDDFRYSSGVLGNKSYGFNIRYASDPFWGLKIAGHMYRADNFLGDKDHGIFSIGKTEKRAAVYKDSSTRTPFDFVDDNFFVSFDESTEENGRVKTYTSLSDQKTWMDIDDIEKLNIH